MNSDAGGNFVSTFCLILFKGRVFRGLSVLSGQSSSTCWKHTLVLIKIANLQPFLVYTLYTLEKITENPRGGLFIWVKSINTSYITSKLKECLHANEKLHLHFTLK